jgi:uncharacterized OsmC-like protein
VAPDGEGAEVTPTETLFAAVAAVCLVCTVALIALIHAEPVDNSGDKP